jgi:hypothetical protein
MRRGELPEVHGAEEEGIGPGRTAAERAQLGSFDGAGPDVLDPGCRRGGPETEVEFEERPRVIPGLPVVALSLEVLLVDGSLRKACPTGFDEYGPSFRKPGVLDEDVEIGGRAGFRTRPEARTEVHPLDGHPGDAGLVEGAADAAEVMLEVEAPDGGAEELSAPRLGDTEAELHGG